MKVILINIVSLLEIGCAQLDTHQVADLCQLDGPSRSTIFEKVSKGSIDDLKSVIVSLQCLDGGDLEDAHIAIGIGLFRYPDQFAPQLRSGPIGMNDLQSISTMLPARFVDESCKAVVELLRRKRVAQQTDELGDWKQSMLAAIDESLQSKKRHCLEDGGNVP